MAEEILPTLTLEDMDFEGNVNCEPGRVGGEIFSRLNDIIYLPKSGDPALIGKILSDFRSPEKRGNFPIEYHDFSIGAAITDRRFFFSPRCFNETDSLTDLFWKGLQERKKANANPESKEYRYWDQIVKTARPKKGCLLYWVGKGESRIQVLFLKEPAMDVLFGSGAKKAPNGQEVPPIPGLIKEMRELGESPFNLKSSTGWVKLYKTGTGSSTQFHAELDQIRTEETVKGKRRFSLEPAEAAVDPAILKVDSKTIPEFKKICKERAWRDNYRDGSSGDRGLLGLE